MRILYVEDNAVNLSLIQRIAQMNQHELISYEEAEVALKALENGEKVDLILLDIQLAGEMDGIDFAKALRARGDQHPIIAITAYAMMGDKERILSAGCNEYLPKPLPIAEFLTLLAKYDPAVYRPGLASAIPASQTKPKPPTKPLANAPTSTTEMVAPSNNAGKPDTRTPIPGAISGVANPAPSPSPSPTTPPANTSPSPAAGTSTATSSNGTADATSPPAPGSPGATLETKAPAPLNTTPPPPLTEASAAPMPPIEVPEPTRGDEETRRLEPVVPLPDEPASQEEKT